MGMWLFLRCSGVAGGELGGEDGASVGEELFEGRGNAPGSKSLSGIGGESNGLRVVRTRKSRRIALK
jgi:hypothetical protein